jgi:thiamine biosynthesis protein ThiS
LTQKGGLAKQMPEIRVRFFGFNRKASGFEAETLHVSDGTTVGDLWASLRSSAHPDEILARVDERTVAVLVNRRVIDREQIRQTVLTEGDTVTFMVFVMGG